MPVKTKLVPVIVTTEHRGVFFGYVKEMTDATELTLKDAQMAVYWSSDVHGILGLASGGPSKNCRITPKIPSIVLQKVTSVMECTPEASDKWSKAPWS